MRLLFRIGGFLPFIGMMFLNAFVDLGHKIIIQNTVFKLYTGNFQVILTALVNAMMLLPFILLPCFPDIVQFGSFMNVS